jgi:hypothetical protein
MRVAPADVPSPAVLDIGSHVRCVLFFGTIRYWDAAAARIVPIAADHLTVDMANVREKETDLGPLTLVATPSSIDGVDVPEPTYRQRIQTAVGLLIAWEGRNITYERLFENDVGVGTNAVSAVGPTLENPMYFPAPDLSPGRLTLIGSAAAAIDALSPEVQRRVELSIRWYEAGVCSSGVDSFLRLWVAIETLGMPSTTDIGPLINLLARAYGVSAAEIRRHYQIGRIFGLRGSIVHDGHRGPIHGHLLDFLAAVYADALAQTLGVTVIREADRVLARPGFDLAAYLP